MVNPLDMLVKFIFDNIFIIVAVGLVGYFAYMYLKIKRVPKYKVIDREEVERQKFVEAMRFNKNSNFKYLYNAKIKAFNGGKADGLIKNGYVFTNEKKIG